MRTNSTTLKDIAITLGVSISTVSKALSDSHEISIHTKKKVLKVADILKYRPNFHASALRSNKSFILGVILPDLKDSFFLDILNGITEESSKNEYKIMVYLTRNDYNKEIEYSNLLSRSNIIDGLIFSSTKKTLNAPQSDHLNNFIHKGVPITYIEKQNRVSVNSCRHKIGFETGRNSVKELLFKLKSLELDFSA